MLDNFKLKNTLTQKLINGLPFTQKLAEIKLFELVYFITFYTFVF